ncbi:PD-(D/E)XK nuclease family protein [Rickettsia oklahomensis]|uniref:PD-(D/E)XK nuclease family protein n=1 Tax=Rickettsia oklahomensis TaxID=3141789 RepID=A0AAU7BY39_9RICK
MATDYSFLKSFAKYIIDKLGKGAEVQIILPNNFLCLELKKLLIDKYKIKLPVIIPFTSIISKKNHNSDYVSKIEELFILSEIINEYKEFPFNIASSLKAAEILRKLFNDLILNNIDIKLIEFYNNSNYWHKIYKFLEYCFLRWQEEISLIVNSSSFGDRCEKKNLYINRQYYEQRSTKKWGSIHYTQKQNKAVYKLKLLQEEIIKIKNGHKQIILAGIFKPDPFLKKFEKELKDYIIYYNPNLSAIDFLHNVANKQESVGDTERRTTMYTDICEDSSTRSTHILPLEASYTKSLNNISYLEPNDIYEEAKQIAYICNRNKDKRIAIVTDNNKLKRVYCNFLDKYEDLIGNDLGLTNISALLTSIIKILCNNFDLKILFLLLKNPLINCPMIQKLELMLSNKNRFISSPEYLLQLQFDNENIREYCHNLIDILFTDTPRNIQAILIAAKEIAEKLLPTIWEKEGGAELLEFLTNLTAYSQYINLTNKKDFHKIFSFLLSNIKFYKNTESANIIIGSPTDLVLCEFDLIILPHFNTDNWSPNKKVHPWLSKKALQILNIDYDEIDSTLYSDYFNLFLQNKQVIILNAKKYDEKLTNTSNLFLKLQKDCVSSHNLITGSSHYMDTVVKPRYDNESTALNTFFPPTLSVTDIETLIRNPYGFYAKKILGLRKKDNIWEEPKISAFGNFIHKVLEEYSKNYDKQYINLNLLDKQNALINIGNHILYNTILPVYTKKAWQIKLVAFSKAFILFDIERRKNCKEIYFEVKGELRLNVAGQDIKIIGIADRIEISKSNNITILDYKTGTIATKKEIELGLSPQLIIESLMLLENGFTECHSCFHVNPVINHEITIAYVKITSINPYIQITEIALNIETLNRHKAGLVKLLEHYITNKFFSYDLNLSKYNDYLHLSRCHTAT